MSTKRLFELADRLEKRANENEVSVSEALQETMIEINKIRDFAMMLADEASYSTEEQVTRKSLALMANRVASMLHHTLAKLNNIQALAKFEKKKHLLKE